MIDLTSEYEDAINNNDHIKLMNLQKIGNSYVQFDKIPAMIFEDACETKNLDDVIDILKKYPNINVKRNDYPLKGACVHGKLDVAQYIYYNYYNNSDGNLLNDIFVSVCLYGRIDTAKWIYSICNLTIDALSMGFAHACSRGHIDIVKWLMTDAHNRIDYHAKNNAAYRWSNDKGHTEVVNCIKHLYV